MLNNTQKGKRGEDLACQFLEKNGFEIIERNFRHSHSEIDIIALHAKRLIFFEVKYRKSTKFGEPEQSISKSKINKIKQASEHYIFEKDWKGDIRFDVIAIKEISTKIEIMHFEDAF